MPSAAPDRTSARAEQDALAEEVRQTRARRSRPRRAGGIDGRHGMSIGTVVAWIVLLAWGAFALLPVVWLLLATMKTSVQVVTGSPLSVGSPSNIRQTWDHIYAFQSGAIVQWFMNSVILAAASVVLAVVVTVPAGYALGSLDFALRKPILMASLALMLLPPAAMVLPLFLEMNVFGLVGSRLAVIFPLSIFPFGLYVAFVYFSTTISREIYDAARTDGCSEWGVFLRVSLPLAKPVVALVAFFTFVRSWNNFVLPFVMLGSDKAPLPVGLALLASDTPEISPGANPLAGIHIPELALATAITMLPVAATVVIAQRTILRGSGAVAGALRG